MQTILICVLVLLSSYSYAESKTDKKASKNAKTSFVKDEPENDEEEVVIEKIEVGEFQKADTPVAPKTKPTKEKKKKGFSFGLEKGFALNNYSNVPLTLQKSDMQPPLGTFKFGYNPNYRVKFQPTVDFAMAFLNGGGQFGYLQAGVFLDFPAFHLYGGFEGFTTFSGGKYDGTLLDNTGSGYYLKGFFPLGGSILVWKFVFDKLAKRLSAKHEGVTTYVDHKGDYIIRPQVRIDFDNVKVWAAHTLYQVGDTAVGSKDFAIAIGNTGFQVFSVGVGFEYFGAEIWLKGHHLEGIGDEIAHFYQVPQFYPDFLIARESAFVEVLWKF